VDGVLTDGRIYYSGRGEQLQSFYVQDGFGIKAAQRAGIIVAVISGRRSGAVKHRCRELDIHHVLQGVQDKLAAFARLAARLKVTAAECACIGDDVPDVTLMRRLGRSYAVPDGHAAARAAAHTITRLRGGRGAVREVCDELTRARRRPRRRS